MIHQVAALNRPARRVILAFLSVAALPAASQSTHPNVVNSQATNNLNPGKTFCLPIQQIAGTNGGKVSGGGFSFTVDGVPIATLWILCNGSTRSNLHIISQVTSSCSVVEKTVPIGSFYRACITNTTNGVIAFSI